MLRRSVGTAFLALGLALLLAQPITGPLTVPPSRARQATASPATSSAQHAAIAARYGQLPLAFEANQGQADPSIQFLAHSSGYTLALTSSEALLILTPGVAATSRGRFALPGLPAPFAGPSGPRQPPTLLGMRWLGANSHPTFAGQDPLSGTVNEFLGNDPTKWQINIPTYQQVRLHDVYPGVDLVYYGNQGQLEYDFVVAPGANPAAIQLGFTGASRLGVDLAGNLSLALPGGTIAQEKPLVYQTAANGARQTVAGGYTLDANHHISFALGAYNPHLPLVIDPAYRFSTYLGGTNYDVGYAIALDASGNAYVTGQTDSSDFPTTAGVVQGSLGSGGYDVFVTKLNAAGTALVYSTYLGGNGIDVGYAIAVDGSGNAYLAGQTTSTNFPTTVGALQTAYGGGNDDTFVSKLNATGSALVYSTYLGGSDNDDIYGIALDSSGNAYVTGGTNSTDFPTTTGAFQTSLAGSDDAFVSKLNADGAALAYSTLLGGTNYDFGTGIAVNSDGNAFIAGYTYSTDFPTTEGVYQTSFGGGTYDAFATELNAAGSALAYSTYLGGSGNDYAASIALDSGGNAYIAGWTTSSNYPTTPGVFQTSLAGAAGDAFVTKLNAGGSALAYSTYLGGGGGSQGDIGDSIAVDGNGDAYLTGYTTSTNFPLVNPLQATLLSTAGGDGLVTKVNTSGSALLFSTYLGGSNTDGDQAYGLALGAGGTVYVVGITKSTDFPTANALDPTYAGGSDAFVTKINTLPSVDTTTGVFRPSNGVLYLKNANTTGPADITLDYGLPGDQPVTGDWTGKGYKSIGVYRNGTFYLRNSNTTGYADIVVPFGASTDIPVAGDWTGKGYDSIGVYRPSNNTFYLRNSNTSGPPDITARLGISGDVPIVGDWTGKGFDSIGVFRPSNGIVYLRNSNTTGNADLNFVYGKAGDKPVVGDWNADGVDTLGVDRNGTFLLRNSNSTGPADLHFTLGVSGDDPIAGPWLAPASAPPPVHRGAPNLNATPASHTAATPPKARVPRR